jgi:hypothetical protein
MGRTISYRDSEGNCYRSLRHYEGGTLLIDGSTETITDVTVNYRTLFAQYFDDGYFGLDGMKGIDAAPTLERAVQELGTERDNDYWKPTKGNVGTLMNLLLGWCKDNPDGTFRVW